MARIFISYSHDSDQHKAAVRELAGFLRNTPSLDVVIDQDMLPGGPNEGWPYWSEDQVRRADKVLVACTENYRRRYLGREEQDVGLGSVCEARLIHQELYNSAGINPKYRVILLQESYNQYVPDTLQAYHRFAVYRPEERDSLVQWLLGRSSAKPVNPPILVWPNIANGYQWGMADRKDVTARFERMLSGEPGIRVLLISAESNSGKTHMVGELKQYAWQLGIACSLVDCKGSQSLEEILQSLVVDLHTLFPQSRLATANQRAWTMLGEVQQLTRPVLLIFDTYEAILDDAKKWIEAQLLPRTAPRGALAVVIAGQTVPDLRKYTWANRAEHVLLQPIRDETHWLEYTQMKGMQLPLESIRVVALAGEGQPGVVYPLLENLARNQSMAGARNG